MNIDVGPVKPDTPTTAPMDIGFGSIPPRPPSPLERLLRWLTGRLGPSPEPEISRPRYVDKDDFFIGWRIR